MVAFLHGLSDKTVQDLVKDPRPFYCGKFYSGLCPNTRSITNLQVRCASTATAIITFAGGSGSRWRNGWRKSTVSPRNGPLSISIWIGAASIFRSVGSIKLATVSGSCSVIFFDLLVSSHIAHREARNPRYPSRKDPMTPSSSFDKMQGTVTSRPIIRISAPDRRTMFAASGSQRMLYSG